MTLHYLFRAWAEFALDEKGIFWMVAKPLGGTTMFAYALFICSSLANYCLGVAMLELNLCTMGGRRYAFVLARWLLALLCTTNVLLLFLSGNMDSGQVSLVRWLDAGLSAVLLLWAGFWLGLLLKARWAAEHQGQRSLRWWMNLALVVVIWLVVYGAVQLLGPGLDKAVFKPLIHLPTWVEGPVFFFALASRILLAWATAAVWVEHPVRWVPDHAKVEKMGLLNLVNAWRAVGTPPWEIVRAHGGIIRR